MIPFVRASPARSCRSRRLGALLVIVSAASIAGSAAAAPAPTARHPTTAQPTRDSAAVVATVHAFHAALARGDSAAALTLLTPDVRIVESGGVESLAEYRAHHLPGDIEYARGVPSTRGAMQVTVRGDVAWAVSTSETKGEFRGRPVNSAGAELVVLTRAPGGWRISAIHWSSRRRTS